MYKRGISLLTGFCYKSGLHVKFDFRIKIELVKAVIKFFSFLKNKQLLVL